MLSCYFRKYGSGRFYDLDVYRNGFGSFRFGRGGSYAAFLVFLYYAVSDFISCTRSEIGGFECGGSED